MSIYLGDRAADMARVRHESGMAPIAQESPVQPFTPPETSNQVGVALDALQQEFANALTGHRACQWEAGDIAVRALAACPTRKERAVVMGALASLGHCTASFVRQLAQVSRTYEPVYRKPDVAWSLYRACMRASSRSGLGTAPSLLLHALDQGWHCAEVDALDQAHPQREPVSSLRETCGECGAKVSISVAGLGGMMVSCPVCWAVQLEDKKHDGLFAIRVKTTLGTLS